MRLCCWCCMGSRQLALSLGRRQGFLPCFPCRGWGCGGQRPQAFDLAPSIAAKEYQDRGEADSQGSWLPSNSSDSFPQWHEVPSPCLLPGSLHTLVTLAP